MDNSLILNRIKAKKNLSTNVELADFLGVKPNTIATWKTRNTLDFELIVSKCEDDDLNWILTGKMAKNQTIIEERPIIELNISEGKPNVLVADIKASAGFGRIVDNHKELENLPAITLPNAPLGLNIAFQIQGESMYPTIRNMSYVAGNRLTDIDDVRDGFVYIIVDRDDGVLCKRLERLGNDAFIIKSDNSNYNSYSRSKEDILAIFKAFYYLSNDFTFKDTDNNERISALESDMKKVKNMLDIKDYFKK